MANKSPETKFCLLFRRSLKVGLVSVASVFSTTVNFFNPEICGLYAGGEVERPKDSLWLRCLTHSTNSLEDLSLTVKRLVIRTAQGCCSTILSAVWAKAQ